MTEHEKLVAAVKDAFDQCQKEFYVPNPQHFMDHEQLKECRERQDLWRQNHEWVAAMRTGEATAKKTGIKIIVGAFVTFVIASVVMRFIK